MKPVLTAEEFRRVDKAYAGDLIVAMDRAGHAVSLAAARHGAAYGTRVAVLAGPGNNGGDGYVAARYLRGRGVAVEVRAFGEPKTAESIDAAAKARAAGVPVRPLSEVEPADLVIDALFGGGVRAGLPGEIISWMETDSDVIAVDFPTGLDPDCGLVADRAFAAIETVTFGTLKTGHLRGRGPELCGTVTVADIGIDGGEPSMFVAEVEDAPRPTRPQQAHKWSAGSVLVVGGSPGMLGAAVFAGRSALAFGAGSVYLATSHTEGAQVVAPELPALSLERAGEELDRFDVVVAGPGLSESDLADVGSLLSRAGKVVLDAGGLTERGLAMATAGDSDVVITPHDAEFARVSGVSAGTYSVRAFAGKEGLTVLRKGNPTMISDGGLPILITTGGPELASIGTGDVLAGMIGALWARGLGPGEAAVSGAFWHGVAGADLASSGTVTAAGLVEKVREYAW